MSTPNNVKPLVPSLKAGGRALGIIPETFDDCFRLAQCAAASNTIPSGHDKTPEAVCMVIMFGLELGIPPMQAIQGITKINGKFCIYGDLVPALLWSHGFDIEQTLEGDGDQMVARCTITRPNGKVITRTFSVDDAKTAQLWGKSGPWKNFPKRMLGWRALGFAKSDGASDIMRGMSIVELERDIATDLTSKPPVLDVPDIPEAVAEPGINQDVLPLDVNQDAQVEPLANPKAYLTHLGEEMSVATDVDVLGEIWATHLETSDGRLSREHATEAENLFAEHEKRLRKASKG